MRKKVTENAQIPLIKARIKMKAITKMLVFFMFF